jgi:NADH dehydrogenase (ubiquinone) Fe-S protein 3
VTVNKSSSIGAASLGSLGSIIPQWVLKAQLVQNESSVLIQSDYLYHCLFFLKYHTATRYRVLVDVCGVDYPSRKDRFDVVYHLVSVEYNARIRIQTRVDEITPLCTVSTVFPSAGWWEREVWDMFGVCFSNHPRRILTDYGFEGHPLRKDFPLSGYCEVRYDDSEKRVVSEPIELTQEYRSFDYQSV